MPLTKLKRIAQEKGLTIVQCSDSHLQIKGGPLLINYYPFSRRQTAYVDGTTMGQAHVTPERAVEMALGEAKAILIPKKGKRGKMRRAKKRLWKRDPHECHWCQTPLTMETATVDHRIALSRGGLHNDNNMVLACGPCNQNKDSRMPTYDTIQDLLKARGMLDEKEDS